MQDTPRAQRRLVLQGRGAMLLPSSCAAAAELGRTMERYPESFEQLVQKVGIKS